MSEKTYNYRKENGICTKCGKEKADKGYFTCTACRKNARENKKKDREYLKKMKICPRCGSNKLFGDEKTCPECLAYMYEYNQTHKSIRNKEKSQERIKRMKENGICLRCCKRTSVVGKSYCSICLNKYKEESSRNRKKKSKNEWIDRHERADYGFCYFCGVKLDRKGRSCTKCAEKVKNNLPSIQSKKGHIWNEDNKIAFAK